MLLSYLKKSRYYYQKNLHFLKWKKKLVNHVQMLVKAVCIYFAQITGKIHEFISFPPNKK